MRLVLLVVTPALFWIGLFGLIGAARLGRVDSAFLLMSINHAFVLIAISGLLLLARVLPRHKLALSTSVVFLSLFGFVSPLLWSDWQSQRVGLNEFALTLSLLSGLLMFVVRPSGGPLAFRPGRMALLTAVLGSFFSVFAAYVLIERDVDQVRKHAQIQVESLRDDVITAIKASVSAIDRLAARWSTVQEGMPSAYVQSEFEGIIKGFDAFKRITHIDLSLRPRHDTVSDATYAGALERALQQEDFRSFLYHAIKTGEVHLAPAGAFHPDPKVGFIVATITAGDVVERLVVGTVDFQELALDRIDAAELSCCYQIVSNGKVIHEEPMSGSQRALAITSDRAELHHDMEMQFRYWHTGSSTRVGQPWLPEGMLLFGLVFTFLANSSQQLTHVVRRRNLQLRHSALHDALTGLPNRRMLAQEMRRAKTRAESDGSSLSVVFLELDGLRLISDSLGHEAADRLLVETARRLRVLLASQAVLARLDSGDFVVCVPGLTQQEVEALTRQILSVVQEPFDIDGRHLRITAFAGISRASGERVKPMQMVRQADMAMLKARKSGYASWRYYTPELGEQVDARLALFNDLQTAIDDGTIQLRYQPIIDGHTGSVVSFEVLMRHPHPRLGEISPAVFIPMAEESGQIIQLTDWLLLQACEDAKKLQAGGYAQVPVAINISPRYFQLANFVERIRSALTAAQLAPDMLHLEITESVLVDDATLAISKLQQLRDMGVEAGLDDFGTGYSSLAYLRQLPIAKIKIDRTFVCNVTSEPADAAIVRGLIAMAHHLHLKVVAEGIETVDQFSFLKRSGCNYFQGYLFDRPLLLQDLLAGAASGVVPRKLVSTGMAFGSARGKRRFVTLLVGPDRWAQPLLHGLAAQIPNSQHVTSGSAALAWLAQHDVDLIVVQEGLADMGTGTFLSKLSDMYPQIHRWLCSEDHMSVLSATSAIQARVGRTATSDFAHRIWPLQPEPTALAQAAAALDVSEREPSVHEHLVGENSIH